MMEKTKTEAGMAKPTITLKGEGPSGAMAIAANTMTVISNEAPMSRPFSGRPAYRCPRPGARKLSNPATHGFLVAVDTKFVLTSLN
jgi:hypothetical protein